jgi:hypothetical protein
LDAIVEKALKKAKKAKEYWDNIQEKAIDDLMFLSDDQCAQWNQDDYNSRIKSGKPALTIDQLSQFVNQVSNDIRMNTPSINIIAADGGDPEVAEIIEGKIREIQNNSNADDAYDNAVNFAIKSSLGFIRIDHDYLDDKSFDQELFIDRVVNPNSILFDPESIEPDGSDARCAFVFENMSREDFEEQYPDYSPISFIKEDQKDEIVLVEYFNIEEQDIFIVMDEMGQVSEVDKLPEAGIIRSRKSKKRVVYRYKLSGQDVLEESIFPGEYIPIVPVYGEEAWIDGKRNLYSLIRRSKDAQRMYNYWASLETEILMKAPKAPIMAVEGTVEDFAEDWMNPDKAAVMRYKQEDSSGRPAPPPQFTQPVAPPIGIINARQSSIQDIRSTMGLYDSFIGMQDNAVSGIAIQGRQREGDRAVYHFMDNLTRSITQVGRILVSALPVVYDTPRVVQIIGKEETNDFVGINGMIVEGQERAYDLTQGNYAVTVTTGASYATMRQEAAEFFERVIMSQPQLMNIMGDLLFKYSDFPGAQAMSERMKKLIDPNILDEEADPQVMVLQAQNEELQGNMQILQAEIGNLQKALQDKQQEIEIKAQSEIFDAEADKRRHQIEVAKLQLEEQKITVELSLKKQELDLKIAEAIQKQENKDRDDIKEVILQVDEFGNFI